MKILICFFICSSLLFSAQAQTDFQKHFDFSSFDVLSDMIQTSDNNLLLCGYTSYGILVIKTDLNGEVIWQKDFDWLQNAKAYDICESNTSDIYLGGIYNSNHGFIMRLNKNGDSITSKVFDSDSYIYAIGSFGYHILISLQVPYPGYNDGYTHIFSTDTLFNNTAISSTYISCMIHKIAVDGNDWYLLGNDTWWCESFITKAFSFKNEYSEQDPDDLIVSENNSIYYSYAGGSWGTIIKTNELGEILWKSTIFPNNNRALALNLYKSKLIASGYISYSNEYYFSIIDTIDGEVDTTFLFNNYCSQFGVGMVINENDLYIAGHFKETDSIDDLDLFLYKYSLDTLITGIDRSKRNIENLKVYPNPVCDKLNISLGNIDHHKNSALKIYNLTGKLIYETSINKQQNEISTTVITWPQGIYIAVLYCNESIIGQCKFLVQ